MTNEKSLEEVFDDVVYETNAQSVFHRLEDLDNQRNNLLSRWVWELVQNARGTAGSQGRLAIQVIYSGDELIFRHNGAVFRDREIAHLVYHGSSKRDPKDIGRYGTGFISTHLISRRVGVRGRLDDGRGFDFILDRGGKDPDELRAGMDWSRAKFLDSLKSQVPSVPEPYTTEYRYPVAESVREVVGHGVDALRQAVPYLFAFNEMLHQISIHDGRSRAMSLTREAFQAVAPHTVRFGICVDDSEPTQWVVVHGDEEVSAAIVVDDVRTVPKLHLAAGMPRLFLAFPLNRTQDLCVPMVMNSALFHPRDQRDGIPLGVAQNEANEQNKALFQRGCEHMVELFDLAAQQGWLGVPDVASLPKGAHPDWANGEWLQGIVGTVLIGALRQRTVLRTHAGPLASPATAWIPVGHGSATCSDLWHVTAHLREAAAHLPRMDEHEAWSLAVCSWAPYLERGVADLRELWRVDDLAGGLDGMRGVEQVRSNLVDGMDPFGWINQIHRLVYQADRLDLFGKLALVPSQTEKLCLLSSLERDGGIDDELKQIADLLGVETRAELVHSKVTTATLLESLAVRTEEQVVAELVDAVRRGASTATRSEAFCDANVRLFTWLLSRGKLDSFDAYPVRVVGDVDGEATYVSLRSVDTPAERLLAPVGLWPPSAAQYAELFPESSLLHSRYAESCGEVEVWRPLTERKFLHMAPLYETEAIVEQFLPDVEVDDEDEDQTPRSQIPVARSDVAMLSKVIDRVRNSRSRALRLIRFIVEYLLPSDAQALQVGAVPCDDDAIHSYYRANWLGQLKSRHWVPLEKGKGDRPSAKGIAFLLADQPDLLKRLGEPRVAAFLGVLGVSAAEVALQSVGKDDAERLALMQSFAAISEASGNDPSKVQELAAMIRADPEALAVLREREARRQRVRRNQKLGDLVEGLFRESFKGTGVAVNRTGTGSDYALGTAVAGEEEDAAKLEIGVGADAVLVEIKATTGTAVRMSTRQVGEAVRHRDRYLLCAIMIPDDTDIDMGFFKENARFVTDIGRRLERLWNEYGSVYQVVSDAERVDEGVELEMTEQQVRFSVRHEVWRLAADFTAILAIVTERMKRTAQESVGGPHRGTASKTGIQSAERKRKR